MTNNHIATIRKMLADWPAPKQWQVIGFSAATLVLWLFLLKNGGTFFCLDSVNLPVHEIGHIIFAPLGMFMTALGGSVMQCLAPFLLAIGFFKKREPLGLAFCVIWCGQNFLSVAIYIGDAQEMALLLVSLGGGEAIHDWNWLLGRMGLLGWSRGLSWLVFIIGWAIMIAGACGYLLFWRAKTGLAGARTRQDKDRAAALAAKMREMRRRRK